MYRALTGDVDIRYDFLPALRYCPLAVLPPPSLTCVGGAKQPTYTWLVPDLRPDTIKNSPSVTKPCLHNVTVDRLATCRHTTNKQKVLKATLVNTDSGQLVL